MSWKDILKNNVTTTHDLMEYMSLTKEQEKILHEILCRFPMSATRYYLSLVDWENVDTDPIFRLAVPSISETDLSGSFDTSGESSNTKFQGLQHKYRQTVLVLTTHECAMYCRHCFRKRLVGLDNQKETAGVPYKVAEYVKNHPEVTNVLLTGGDSFLLDNEIIELYLSLLTEISHLDFIRFGTRTPVTFPARITQDPDLCKILKKYNQKKQIFIVTHYNHPREVTEESVKAVRMLQDAGLVIRNQTVLLRGVNDDAAVLSELMGKLTSIGIVPYYIFQCRPVRGVKNQFQLPIKEGLSIVEKAKGMMNGQGKSVRYAMSHPMGKIEIVGEMPDGQVIFKFHQAKDPENLGKVFFSDMKDDPNWLGQIELS